MENINTVWAKTAGLNGRIRSLLRLSTYEKYDDLSGLDIDYQDKERVFLYFTLDDAMLMMGCGYGKAVRLFAELDKESGIGLIERKKQGQGKPLNFM